MTASSSDAWEDIGTRKAIIDRRTKTSSICVTCLVIMNSDPMVALSFPLVGNPSDKPSERFRPSRNDKLPAKRFHLGTDSHQRKSSWRWRAKRPAIASVFCIGKTGFRLILI